MSDKRKLTPEEQDQLTNMMETMRDSGKDVSFRPYEASTGSNQPILREYEPETLMKIALDALENTPVGETPWSFLPSNESLGTKKNRIRIDPTDRRSPMGVVMKNDPNINMVYRDRAVVRYKALDVLLWGLTQIILEGKITDVDSIRESLYKEFGIDLDSYIREFRNTNIEEIGSK